MLHVILIMTTGIITGILIRQLKKIVNICGKLTMFAIYVLLFVLGISIGANQEIIRNLPRLGMVALLIAVFSVLGSISLSWLVYKKIMKPTVKQ